MELTTPLMGAFRTFARPVWHGLNQLIYTGRFQKRVREVTARYGKRVCPQYEGVRPVARPDAIWDHLRSVAPAATAFYVADLEADPQNLGGRRYLARHDATYRDTGNARELAVEHALTFELADLTGVKRYCDLAASRSPLEPVLAAEQPGIEYWKQDLTFKSDPSRRILGGYAQHMRDVPAGFFDLMTLYRSFDPFTEHSDSELVLEVDRVLSPRGACFVLPLQMDLEPKVYFDPTLVTLQTVATFDREAKLCPAFEYRQIHGRFYSPETLARRVLEKAPASLRTSVIRFGRENRPGRGLHLRFALVLHRKDSIFRADRLRSV